MARTLSGKCIGQARRIELEDERVAREARSAEFLRRFNVAVDRLQLVDPDGWAEFYDSRPEQTCGEMLPLIENRVADIEISKFGAALRERQEKSWKDAELERDRRAEIDFARYGY